MEKEEASRVANMLNCKLGHLPLTYLGIKIGDRVLGKKFADNILNKMRKRLDNLRNNLLSWGGGRLVLVNSGLSSQPIYTMGFYSLNGDTHKKMDTIRSRFSGGRLVKNSSIIWLNGKQSVGLKILGLWG